MRKNPHRLSVAVERKQMLSELCRELRNWFDRGQPKLHGAFEVSGGKITDDDFTTAIQNNQYFRIVGSVFNDGVYQYTDALELTDELFVGSIWFMAVPREVVALSNEIVDWINKYGDVMNSPYASESFGGYSYTKASGGSNGGSSDASWQRAFADRLNLWRKI